MSPPQANASSWHRCCRRLQTPPRSYHGRRKPCGSYTTSQARRRRRGQQFRNWTGWRLDPVANRPPSGDPAVISIPDANSPPLPREASPRTWRDVFRDQLTVIPIEQAIPIDLLLLGTDMPAFFNHLVNLDPEWSPEWQLSEYVWLTAGILFVGGGAALCAISVHPPNRCSLPADPLGGRGLAMTENEVEGRPLPGWDAERLAATGTLYAAYAAYVRGVVRPQFLESSACEI